MAASSTRKRASSTKTSPTSSRTSARSSPRATKKSPSSTAKALPKPTTASRTKNQAGVTSSAVARPLKAAKPTPIGAKNALPSVKTPPSQSAAAPQPPQSSPSASTTARAELASRELARRDLVHFTQRLNPRYDAGWVHRDIARRLKRFSEDVAKGLSPRLLLLMPPRHGKSELASRMFPAWHLGHCPDHEIIACSYNVSLAMSFSRKVKDVMADPVYQNVFKTRVDPSNQSVEAWGLQGTRGGYVAAGVGGGITGKGAHILIIDDPIKNAEEADSADIREKLFDWYGSTAYTRLAPGGGVLIIQTWWHDDDLAGRVQTAAKADSEADQFEVVKYPAIAEDDEYLDLQTDRIVLAVDIGEELERMTPAEMSCAFKRLRRKGDALHPARYDTVKLHRIRKTIQPRFWAALYQQNPVPDDGGYFSKEQFRQMALPDKERCHVYIAWDFAISEKEQNDYTVGSVGLHDEDDVLHVAEVVRFRSGDAFKIVEAILNTAARWYSPTLTVGFEDGQIFRAIQALLLKRMKERRLFFAIQVLKPITDKMARARPLQGRMQQGMVNFAPGGEWYSVVKTEMLRFPAGVHDDCVDSLAWLTQIVIDKPPPRKKKPKGLPSFKDRLNAIARGGTAQGHMVA